MEPTFNVVHHKTQMKMMRVDDGTREDVIHTWFFPWFGLFLFIRFVLAFFPQVGLKSSQVSVQFANVFIHLWVNQQLKIVNSSTPSYYTNSVSCGFNTNIVHVYVLMNMAQNSTYKYISLFLSVPNIHMSPFNKLYLHHNSKSDAIQASRHYKLCQTT